MKHSTIEQSLLTAAAKYAVGSEIEAIKRGEVGVARDVIKRRLFFVIDKNFGKNVYYSVTKGGAK